ncbi:MAG: DUF262 domain-containing protein [Lachnospiraceae bacterium]|nr:DUF262 domain-containing protein [Lachnospiraceae bacterium]
MQDLTVRSESVQRIYGYYLEQQLVVNRRYQRKLVWSVEEKASFIDSIRKNYPVPLILLAESKGIEGDVLEIIDGMQRLNSITSFIENEFSVDGYYFDLETMAETKLMKDEGVLIQKEPLLGRKECAGITSYVLPMSTYKGASEAEIDEVFRRINANGKHLSKQEIRQAGALSLFAELVRVISSEIRGDVSLNSRLVLNNMREISITSRELNYGINVDEVFWVKSAIIRREQVRESKDEEIIAEIIAAMLFDEIPASSSKILDEYYSLKAINKRAIELEEKIKLRTVDGIKKDFFVVFDVIKGLLNVAGTNFNSLISKDRTFDKVPRYFQIVFLAFYKLIVKENKKIISQFELLKVLDGITANVRLSRGGGNWSAVERDKGINAIVGMIDKCFVENTEDPAIVKWSTELETILKQSNIEQTCFDFKLGFCDIKSGAFNEETYKKCIKTLTAMANRGKNAIGYVIAGVADKKEDADKLQIKSEDYSFIKREGYYITGLNHDIDCMGMSGDKYFQRLIQLLEQEPISDEYKAYIGGNVRLLEYGGKLVLLMKIKGLNEPAIYDNAYYQRMGANLDKIEPRQMKELFERFY